MERGEEKYGLEGVFQTHDEGVIDPTQHASLRFGVFDLVFLLDHRFVQHFHRIDLLLTDLPNLKNLPEAALSDHLQDLEVVESHCRVVQLRILVAVKGIITTWTSSIKRVVITQIGEVDFLDPIWRTLSLNTQTSNKRWPPLA